VSKEGDKVAFDIRLRDYSEFLRGPCDDGNIYNAEENCTTKALEFMRTWLEAHKYDLTTVSWKLPFFSLDLKEHLDDISYKIF